MFLEYEIFYVSVLSNFEKTSVGLSVFLLVCSDSGAFGRPRRTPKLPMLTFFEVRKFDKLRHNFCSHLMGVALRSHV